MTDKPKEDPLSITFAKPGEPLEVVVYGLGCSAHAESLWSDEIFCDPDKGGCGSVWHRRVRSRCPPVDGPNCVCGKPLTGPENVATPICPTCFVSKWHEQQDSSC